jgi:uncharacterized protein YndB with AHSA1/START domain
MTTVQRVVGDRSVTISRDYSADIDDVWDACTNPERIARWFLPVDGDLRLHGRYQLHGNAGGTIVECEPPRYFAATWEYGDEVSRIEVRVTADPDGGTRLEITHLGLTDDAKWLEFGPGAVGVGWELAISGLGTYLCGEPPPDLPSITALSWEGWRDADIAAGTDPVQAKAAAERTAAFYGAS